MSKSDIRSIKGMVIFLTIVTAASVIFMIMMWYRMTIINAIP